jgi:hypothetical protein
MKEDTMGADSNRLRRALHAALATVALGAIAASAVKTPKIVPVTDANVAERVANIRTKNDHLALADYYLAKAHAEESRIDYYDRLFRAYMRIEGKDAEVLQRQSRALLKAARMSKEHYELLAKAHRTRAWEWDE